MATINLSGQAQAKNQFKSASNQFKTEIDKRTFWGKIPVEKKRELIKKDPVLGQAWEQYQYLKQLFEGMDNG